VKITDRFLSWVGRRIFAATQRDKTGFFVDWAQGGLKSSSGEIVSNDKSLQLSTVFACIRAISEDVGKIPLKLYKNVKPRGKEVRSEHPVYRLLHDRPNPEMTAMTFRQTLTAHVLSWGNGFAEIERDIEGVPMALWPIKPNRVRVFRLDDGQIWYEIRTDDDQTAWLPSHRVLHVPGLGFDGLVGYNIIQYARECMGGVMATQKLSSSMFGSGIRSSGILTHPARLSPEAQDRLRQSFEKYSSSDALRLMIIEEGMAYSPSTIPPQEAQFLETKQFSVPEICRWFRMPPSKVADTTRAQGWSTLEQTNMNYVTDTLMPWFVRWEQEIWRKLLNPREQKKGFFARHVMEGLLRGDIKTRYEAYRVGRNWGWLSADDIRELEDMNPLPDDVGQTYLMPMNMTEAKAPGEEEIVVAETAPPPPEEPDKEEPDKKLFESLASDAAGRIAGAEIRTISKVIGKAEKDRAKFNEWVTSFFNGHGLYVKQVLGPIGTAWREHCGGVFYIGPIVEQLVREGTEAFTQNDLQDAMSAWHADREQNITRLIMGGLQDAAAETE
jgi:HK97 family phage portal protein